MTIGHIGHARGGADSYGMYVVDAATVRSREAVDLPLFEVMLRSVRLLPEH